MIRFFQELREAREGARERVKKEWPRLWWFGKLGIFVWWFVTLPVLILVDVYLWQHDHTNWAIAVALWITIGVLESIPLIVYWWFFLAVAAIVTIALIVAHPLLGAVWCFVIGAGWLGYKHLQLARERNQLRRERWKQLNQPPPPAPQETPPPVPQWKPPPEEEWKQIYNKWRVGQWYKQ